MGRKAKVSFETKLDIVLRCLSGVTSMKYEAELIGVDATNVKRWVSNYQSLGEVGLISSSKNTIYSSDLKKNAVLDYLNGKESLLNICKKYGIRSTKQLRDWILKYNSHKELKTSGTGGRPIMTKGRKTTYEERIEIVQYCIEHQNNYAETSEKFQVSYQQVYAWMKKYEEKGVVALTDNRGRTKPVEEMNEVEKLRLENRLLLSENKRKEMELNFLKKLDEIERGRG
jgi:Transposase and inactivated derivatives